MLVLALFQLLSSCLRKLETSFNGVPLQSQEPQMQNGFGEILLM